MMALTLFQDLCEKQPYQAIKSAKKTPAAY
jgi:hypothetical protein